jgi:hypothetical protein
MPQVARIAPSSGGPSPAPNPRHGLSWEPIQSHETQCAGPPQALSPRVPKVQGGTEMNLLRNFLLLALILVPASIVQAQSAATATKKACDFITKSDAESILGTSVVARLDTPVPTWVGGATTCWFVETGFTSKVPTNHQVNVSISYSASPDPNQYAVIRKNIAGYKDPGAVMKELTDFADAAIWTWTPGWGGDLDAFNGGTIQVKVTISGLPEDAALQNAKALAARVIGRTNGTGYVYLGTPKSNGSIIASQKAAGAAQPLPKTAALAPPASKETPAVASDPYARMQALVKARDEEENRQRWAPPRQSPAAYAPQWMLQNKVVTGTVRRIEIDNSNRPHWLTIYFRESPDATFVVCSASPEIFQEQVGSDLSVLIGQTLEVAGSVSGALCGHKVPKGSIQVYQTAQWQLIAPQKVAGAAPGQEAALAGGKTSGDLPEGNVNLSVCNAGKVDVDVFVARQSPVTNAHIAPAACARVYAEDAAVPAYVGFALADSRGQWGTARRLDLLPDFGVDVLTRADRNVSVRRGNKEVPAQLQLSFRPRDRKCISGLPSNSARLPYNATASQRAYAASADANNARLGLDKSTCETLGYVLNAVAYPDTREITFADKCTQCPSNVHPLSPAQQAAARQTVATLSGLSPAFAQMVNQGEKQVWDESQTRPAVAQRMNWNEMNLALAKVRSGGGRPPEMPESLIIRGTVSRVDVSPPDASVHWVNVIFANHRSRRLRCTKPCTERSTYARQTRAYLRICSARISARA